MSVTPGLTISLAMAAGMIAQAIGWHLRIPSIVILLATGVLLGPDVAGVVNPDVLGNGMQTLVGLAVAVILFEGGMNLNIKKLRQAARPIQQLVTIGAMVTAAGATLTARLVLDWEWRTSILFGTLVIVTGPTVVTPLLRRIKVQRSVSDVLEAEGVLIDAIGAVVATVTIEVMLGGPDEGAGSWLLGVVGRLGFGITAGLVGGLVLASLLRRRHLIPEGLENIFTLGLVLALYELSNMVTEESGIATVVVAGLVVGNVNTHIQKELLEFKEQLTVMLIGLLFVLLAADVRLEDVANLGWGGVLAVGVLVFVVRPLNVFAGTFGTSLTRNQKLFISWIGPRGIVAAAVASLFAQQLEAQNWRGGAELRAMVFLVIAVTVLLAGLTGGRLARMLGLGRASDSGWAILGANHLARALAKALSAEGEDVVCIDSNPLSCRAAHADGLNVIMGNGLEEGVLDDVDMNTRHGAVGATRNEEVNLAFVDKANEEYEVAHTLMALTDKSMGVTIGVAQKAGASVLFRGKLDIELWAVRLRQGTAKLKRWKLVNPIQGADEKEATLESLPFTDILALTLKRGNKTAEPVSLSTHFEEGDRVVFLENDEFETDSVLRDLGWKAIDELEGLITSGPFPSVT